MLDWGHRLALTAVDRGVAEESPALENLVAARLVERGPASDELRITDAGRAGLQASEPSRLESWGIRMAAVGAVALALGTVLGWIVR